MQLSNVAMNVPHALGDIGIGVKARVVGIYQIQNPSAGHSQWAFLNPGAKKELSSRRSSSSLDTKLLGDKLLKDIPSSLGMMYDTQ